MQSFTSLASFGKHHIARGLNRLVEDVVEHGRGVYVTMTSGREMIDFTSGIGVTNLGILGHRSF